jgi:N-acetylglucosamine kinase-like BadF-type ATPase
MGETVKDLVIGVDGGNSGTRALVIDAEGAARGYGEGGNANHQHQGHASAMANIAEAVRGACDAAGCNPRDLAHAHFAIAGDDTEDDHHVLAERLSALFPGVSFGLSNDVWAGLRAGTVSGVGVAVNCGSGCGAVGRNGADERVIIPDVGYIYGDSGGGGQIAVDAVRAVIRAWDGRGEPTALTPLILDLAGQLDEHGLYMALYRKQIPNERLRQATRLVFRAAANGDAVAQGILERIGAELGVAGAAVARRLGLEDVSFTFVLTGGTFRTLQSPLAQATIARMQQAAPRCAPALPRVMPVAGAALLALEAPAGARVTELQYARLSEQGYGWHPEELFTS